MTRATRGRGGRAAWAVVAASGLTGVGCFSPVEMPPPAAPAREVPAVAENLGPAVPGRQYVVLDTPRDRASVSKVVGRLSTTDSDGNTVEGDATRDLCVTPCVTDLHVGAQTLVFTSVDDPGRNDRVDVRLGADPLVVRHVIERTSPGSLGAALLKGLGVSAIIAGSIAGPIEANDGSAGGEAAGYATLGLGAALFVGGIVVAYVERGTHVPAATTVWTIPRSGKATPSALAAHGPLPLLRF